METIRPGKTDMFLFFCSFVWKRGLFFINFGLRKDEIFSSVDSQATNGGLASYSVNNLGQEAFLGCKRLISLCLFFVLLNNKQS